MGRFKAIGWKDGKRVQRTFDSTIYEAKDDAFKLMPFVYHLYEKLGDTWVEVTFVDCWR